MYTLPSLYEFDLLTGEFRAGLSTIKRRKQGTKKSQAEIIADMEARVKKISKKEFMAMILEAVRSPRTKGEYIRNARICEAVGAPCFKGMAWDLSPARRRVSRYLLELRDSGLIESSGDGRWRMLK